MELVKKLLKLKLAVNPIRDDKYIITKLKIFKNINLTTCCSYRKKSLCLYSYNRFSIKN